jgi:hypothetical protein
VAGGWRYRSRLKPLKERWGQIDGNPAELREREHPAHDLFRDFFSEKISGGTIWVRLLRWLDLRQLPLVVEHGFLRLVQAQDQIEAAGG